VGVVPGGAGDSGGGWEAPGHVKSGFIFLILAIAAAHTAGYATIGYWLDLRYCCQTVSLLAREPMHFIFHFEQAGNGAHPVVL